MLVDGTWALRRYFGWDRARVDFFTEAELGTCQAEIALLKSKNKIGEKERELLNHDLENVECALGNVIERVSGDIVRGRRSLHESRVWNKKFYLDMVRIGAVPKPPSDDEDTERPRKKSKKSSSDGTEGPSEPRRPPIGLVFWSCIALDGDMIMPPKAMSEAHMREVIREQVATSMAEFMENINRGAGGAGAGGGGADGGGAGGAEAGGAGPAAPEITGCTYVTFMKCNPQHFKGTKGAVGLCQWFEKLESVFRISDCKERDKVKFATATLQGCALTWWNGRIASMGIDAANGTPWIEVRKWMTKEFCPRSVLQRLEQELYNLKLKRTDIDGYTNRFHELALLCPRMVEPEQVKVEQYIRGLSKNIRGDVTSSRPTGINEAVRMAYQLMGQIIQDKTDEDSCDLFKLPMKGVTEKEIAKLKKDMERGNNRESKEKQLEDVSVIRDFPKVFPDELHGLLPPRKVEFRIDLIPGAAPVRCAISFSTIEMKELSKQLQEL
ncbi:putative reverse transcriptase domain-containing protein [Tanacetum coccineum]